MNFQIGGAKKKIAVGLNTRKREPPKNVFQTEDSSSDEEEKVTGRQAVNRAIVREQEQQHAASATMEAYDFDGTYVDPIANQREDSATVAGGTERKSSRYMEDLVQAAKKRKQERDVVFERKVAREQAAEEAANPEFLGKDKFVTAAYKRKLQERKVWQAEEDEKERIEAENDVTKQSDGLLSFYGSFNKNVSVGGKQESKADRRNEAKGQKTAATNASTAQESKDLHSAANDPERQSGSAHKSNHSTKQGSDSVATKESEKEDDETRRKRERHEREQKVEQARIRYFQRHPL